MKQTHSEQVIRRSMKLLRIEAALTSMTFAMPVLNIFYADELHMSLAQVGVLQALFMAVVIVADFPTGYAADRISHRMANVIGDVLLAAGFAVYALSINFGMALLAECILGVGLAISGGADKALLGAYVRALTDDDASYKALYTKEQARIQYWGLLASALAMIVGGVVGAYSLRATLALDVPVLIAAVIASLWLVDAAEPRVSDKNLLRDAWDALKYVTHGHAPLAWSVAMYAIGNELTHVLVWLLTPMLLIAGVPSWILGIAWALNMLAAVAGNMLASRLSLGLPPWLRFAAPASVCLLAMALFAIDISLYTVPFFLVFGIVRGWYGVVSSGLLQHNAPDDLRNTVASVASTAGRLLYIPAIMGITFLANVSLSGAMLGSLLLFAPLCAVVMFYVRRYVKE